MRLLFCVCVVLLSGLPAKADVADYCAAYARDHADLGEQDKTKWQKRYDNALKNCASQFSVQEPAPSVEKPKPASAAKQKAPPPLQPVTSKKTTAIQALKSGTSEWVEYCKNKYVSFNESTGNYLSKTGIERKCLVTAN